MGIRGENGLVEEKTREKEKVRREIENDIIEIYQTSQRVIHSFLNTSIENDITAVQF